MRCIFCKCDSSNSRSVEHVIPESLGNTEHVLERGVVCDGCNNYFASKVEGPLLSDPYFREQCSIAGILSKKGNLQRVQAIHPHTSSILELVRHLGGSGISVGAASEKDEKRWGDYLLNHDWGRIYVPAPTAPNEVLMSRFLAKVAIECVALRFTPKDGHAEAVVSERALDGLRDYARRGPPQPIWPFFSRSLYPAGFAFQQPGRQPYEVLHEWDFISIGEQELYLVLALFGVEYALNLGQRNVDNYRAWIIENPGRSALYPNGIGGV